MSEYTEINCESPELKNTYIPFKSRMSEMIKELEEFKYKEPIYIPKGKPSDSSRIESDVIGKTLEQAKLIYSDIRIVKENGDGLYVTADMVTGRLNVETNNNNITRVDGWY